MNNCEKACEILRLTRDGNDLAPEHLYLIEVAANDRLTETGLRAFDELHAQVTGGCYVRPWYHDIEHLYKDHQGYVYWKGKQVEHFNYHDYDEAHAAALRLADHCRTLELLGYPVTCENVVWRFEELTGVEETAA